MNNEIKDQFLKRLKSLTWRMGMMLAAFVTAFALENLSSLSLDPTATMMLGLVLGEVSKALNNAINGQG